MGKKKLTLSVDEKLIQSAGGLACYDSWGHKESDTTERLNWTELLLLVTSISFLPFLLSMELHEPLSVSDYGEQIGNWLLTRMLSPLLIPPLLFLVTSISLLPLIFFMWLCELLWVSLTVENLFTINLDVLSSVLYGWRSLEATIKRKL